MDFVDYYAALNLPKNAQIKDVQKAFDHFMDDPDPDRFDLCAKAYATLSNPYKRARYNKIFGHLMIIETSPQTYLNAVHCKLNSIQPYASLQALIEKFKEWILKKYDFDWKEAQLANYSYHLESNAEDFWLVLRFPIQTELEKFRQFLLAHKLVKVGS